MSIAADRIIAISTGKTVYRDGESIIKVFSQPYPKALVFREALNQACMEDSPVRVPHVQRVFYAEQNLAISYEYMRGKTLKRLIAEQPQKSEELLKVLIDTQRLISFSRADMLFPLKDRLASSISAGINDAMLIYELTKLLYSMPEGASACHGSLGLSSILIGEDGAACVINWSRAARGYYLYDAAASYIQLYIEGEQALAEAYISMYCSSNDVSRQAISPWITLCAASRLSEGNARERELLCAFI